MRVTTWLPRRAARQDRRCPRRTRRGGFRPQLEGLEDRTAPAALATNLPLLAVIPPGNAAAGAVQSVTVTAPTFTLSITLTNASLVVRVLSNPTGATSAQPASPGSPPASTSPRADTSTTTSVFVPISNQFLSQFLQRTTAAAEAQAQLSDFQATQFVPPTNLRLLPLGLNGLGIGSLSLLSAFSLNRPLNFPSTPSGTNATASISGTVFQELADRREARLSGQPVLLDFQQDGQLIPVAVTVTDQDGNYVFAGLAAGTYRVRLKTPAGRPQGDNAHLLHLQGTTQATGQDFRAKPAAPKAQPARTLLDPSRPEGSHPGLPRAVLDALFRDWFETQAAEPADGAGAEWRALHRTGEAVASRDAGKGTDAWREETSSVEALALAAVLVAEFELLPCRSNEERKRLGLPL